MGKKAFKRGDYEKAMTFFSLALKANNSDEIYFLINLCEFAFLDEFNAHMIYEYYTLHRPNKSLFEGLDDLIEIITAEHLPSHDIKSADYDDITAIGMQKNFKQNFENMLFSTPIVIDNKNNFINFIEKIVDNKMQNMGYEYLEQAILHLGYDARFDKITKKLKENENRNKK